MRHPLGGTLFSLALAFAALPAQAAFHLFTMNELYSNADGTVQFVELTALAGGQQFVAGHPISACGTGPGHVFTITADLPGDTAGRKFLIGTQGFAALGVVAPDVVVPNGFFYAPGGVVDWAGADTWSYANLPTDGELSLNRDGSTGPNSPTNFAGQTGHVSLSVPVPPPTPASYQGIWWRSPGGSESGWGVNITQQGDILFATWFTYDTDGSGLWLVIPSANRTSGNNFTGTLYRGTGPSFDAVPWDGTGVALTEVGSATFSFSDADNGTFSYTVNGTAQSRPITRYLYATPAYTCLVGGPTGTTPVYQDMWWRSPAGQEAGWGVNITHQGDILFVTWFTYDRARKGMWVVGPAVTKTAEGVYTGALLRTTGPAFSAVPWNPASVASTTVGTVTITFTGLDSATFAYTLDGVTQSKPITRYLYGAPRSFCR